MTLENALKAFRRLNYKYGEAANGVIVSANHSQMSIVVKQAYSIMQGGSAPFEYLPAQRAMHMHGAGTLRFRTIDDVLNNNCAGYVLPFIGITQLAMVDGGMKVENILRVMQRGDIPATEHKFVTLENV